VALPQVIVHTCHSHTDNVVITRFYQTRGKGRMV